MSTGLRTLADPGLYYVSVGDGNDAHYTVNSSGIWGVGGTTDFSDKVFRDLGKTVYYHPVNSLASAPSSVALTAPPVDVRKVAEVTTSGVVTNQVYYIPLGTRVRGLKTQQTGIPTCWVAQVAGGVASVQSGGAAASV